ncbi:MAG: 6-phosphofructokinase [Myxococcota bacterium]
MRIGILTSGGDSPGMNAAVRTVAVAGRARGHEVHGVQRGYEGLLEGDIRPLELAAIEGITRMGGTILGSARSAVFPTPEGQKKAREQLKAHQLDALVVVGGNGSLTGAHLLGSDKPCLIVGLPASIDNDIGHCGLAIGVDTAVNTIVQACDRISDTARAHRRAFLVEVMGRRCGFLAMRAGIAAEADAIVYGERNLSEDEIVGKLRGVLRNCFGGKHKKRALIVKSEGVSIPTSTLCKRLQHHLSEDAPGVEIRETVLGHVVRGGDPSALDRMIAQRLAYGAVVALERGAHDVMLGWDVPGGFGEKTEDSSVRVIKLQDVLDETARLLDGTSPVIQRRVALLNQVEDMLAL